MANSADLLFQINPLSNNIDFQWNGYYDIIATYVDECII